MARDAVTRPRDGRGGLGSGRLRRGGGVGVRGAGLGTQGADAPVQGQRAQQQAHVRPAEQDEEEGPHAAEQGVARTALGGVRRVPALTRSRAALPLRAATGCRARALAEAVVGAARLAVAPPAAPRGPAAAVTLVRALAPVAVRALGATRLPRAVRGALRRRGEGVVVLGRTALLLAAPPAGLLLAGLLLGRRGVRRRGGLLPQQHAAALPFLHRLLGEREESQAAVRHQVSVFPLKDVACHGLRGSNGSVGPRREPHPVNAPRTTRVPGPAPRRRYLPATPPSRGGLPVCRYRC
ncbi:hypothetical protein RKD20_003483 [Streptomyces sp. SLBN-8D4]